MAASTATGVPHAQRGRAVRWRRGLISVAVFLLIAEAASLTGVISPALLPPVLSVLGRTAALLGNTTFLGDLAATLAAWAAGLAITVAVAVPCGVLLGSLPGVRTATRAVVEFLRPIPSVALIPLVGLVLGIGLRMVVTLIIYAAVWPVLINTIYGLDEVDPLAKDTLRASAVAVGRVSGRGRVAGVGGVVRQPVLPPAHGHRGSDVPHVVFRAALPSVPHVHSGRQHLLAVEHRVLAWSRAARQMAA